MKLNNFVDIREVNNIKFWRCISVFGVLMVHLSILIEIKPEILMKIFRFGRYGVWMFFIVSGYLACKSLQSSPPVGKYWLKRFFRVLPLYYFCILVYFLLDYVLQLREIPGDASGLYYKRYWFFLSRIEMSPHAYWYNLGITWTISCFLLFYLIAPFVLKAIRSTNDAWIFFMIFIVIRMIVIKYCNYNYAVLEDLPFFFLGVVVYHTIRQKKNNLTIFVMIFLLLVSYATEYYSPFLPAYSFAVLLILTMNTTIKNKVICAVFNFFDKYSFTIYLVQAIVWDYLIEYLGVPLQPFIYRFMIFVPGTILLSVIVNHIIERPIQKIGNIIINKIYGEKYIQKER